MLALSSAPLGPVGFCSSERRIGAPLFGFLLDNGPTWSLEDVVYSRPSSSFVQRAAQRGSCVFRTPRWTRSENSPVERVDSDSSRFMTTAAEIMLFFPPKGTLIMKLFTAAFHLRLPLIRVCGSSAGLPSPPSPPSADKSSRPGAAEMISQILRKTHLLFKLCLLPSWGEPTSPPPKPISSTPHPPASLISNNKELKCLCLLCLLGPKMQRKHEEWEPRGTDTW